jgi:hypothetical protein
MEVKENFCAHAQLPMAFSWSVKKLQHIPIPLVADILGGFLVRNMSTYVCPSIELSKII